MPIGPGKYDAECTAARLACGAAGAVLIIHDGRQGSGFSAQLDADSLLELPRILRQLADGIEQSVSEEVRDFIRRQ